MHLLSRLDKLVLSPRALEMLRMAVDLNEEVVCENLVAYVDLEAFSRRTVTQLLMCMALKDVSDDARGLRRFVVNDTGEQILKRPALADDVYQAVQKGENFQVVDGEVRPLEPLPGMR